MRRNKLRVKNVLVPIIGKCAEINWENIFDFYPHMEVTKDNK